MKYELICNNEGCPEQGNKKSIGKFVMSYSRKERKMVPKIEGGNPLCLFCGKVLEFIEVDPSIPDFSVGTFKGLPDEEKKKVLKKRFDADSGSRGKDEKEFRKKSAISKMIGYDKQ